jgi:hypothetical protein
MKYIHPKKTYNILRKKAHDLFWYYLLPDKVYLKIKYRKDHNRRLDLNNPHSYNEKLQWLKLFDRNPKYHLLADKFRVKELIEPIIGNSHIIPTIGGPWKKFEEIDFNSLPEKFVLKCNHDSASVVICLDKSNLDLNKAKAKLNNCVKKDYYRDENKQWAYKGIERCIFAEQYIHDEDLDDLPDFKFHCFNGVAKCVLVCVGRNSKAGGHACMNVYDMNWNKLPYEPGFRNIPWEMPKPSNFEEMVAIAEKIAKYVGNCYSRIDLYNVNNHIYFGEITFYPGGGSDKLRPVVWDYILGSWIELNAFKK